MLYAGGSFGGAPTRQSDFVLEAAAIGKAIDGRAPVKLVWGARTTCARALPADVLPSLEGGPRRAGRLIAWRTASSPVDPRPAPRSSRCW